MVLTNLESSSNLLNPLIYISGMKLETTEATQLLLLPVSGASLGLLSSSFVGTSYIWIHDRNSSLYNGYSLRIYGLHNSTNVTICTFDVLHPNTSMDNIQNFTMQIDDLQTFELNCSMIKYGVRILSTLPIGILLETRSLSCNSTEQIIANLIPTSHFGSEFLVTSPPGLTNQHSFICDVMSKYSM